MTAPQIELYSTQESLVIAECYGPVIQGEGPSAGRTASFIRTGGCNLACKWCDSRFTWDASTYDLRAELTRAPVAGILAEVEHHGSSMVVITGGEPLLHQHQEGWRSLLDGLKRLGKRVEVETNGTVTADTYTVACVDAFNVSPKLANAGMTEERRIRPEVLAAFRDTGKAAFKFVCRTADDVDTVAALVTDLDIPTPMVWIMPEGAGREMLAVTAKNTVGRALFYRFNFTHRLHILLWGQERGR